MIDATGVPVGRHYVFDCHCKTNCRVVVNPKDRGIAHAQNQHFTRPKTHVQAGSLTDKPKVFDSWASNEASQEVNAVRFENRCERSVAHTDDGFKTARD